MYNNPFLYQNLYRPSLFSRLFGGLGKVGAARGAFNFGSFLTNTQKSLGIINQAIPLVYQVKPIINNAKTMFRIAGAIKDDNNGSSNTTTSNNKNNSNITNNNNISNINNDNKPIFYI